MRWIVFLSLTLSSLALPFLVKKECKLPPIYEHIPPHNPSWDSGPVPSEVRAILGQKFSYFSSGNQSTVFVSEDGQTVLKLFRYTRSRFQLLHRLKNVFKKKGKMDLMTKIQKTLNGAYLGSSEAKRFTRSIYAHLNLTQNELPTVVLDYKGKVYKLPMDRYRFVLQQKVTPFKEALLNIRDQPELVERSMLSFAKLLSERSSLHIHNSDPNLGPNFGFIDGEAVEVDFGNYHKIAPDREARIREYDNLMNRFEEWVRDHMPEHLLKLKHLRLNVRSTYDAK